MKPHLEYNLYESVIFNTNLCGIRLNG